MKDDTILRAGNSPKALSKMGNPVPVSAQLLALFALKLK